MFSLGLNIAKNQHGFFRGRIISVFEVTTSHLPPICELVNYLGPAFCTHCADRHRLIHKTAAGRAQKISFFLSLSFHFLSCSFHFPFRACSGHVQTVFRPTMVTTNQILTISVRLCAGTGPCRRRSSRTCTHC